MQLVESVSLSVCLSGYAFRHALSYRAESLHGGRGRAHKVCGHIFRSNPTWGQRSSRGQSALEMPYGYQILVSRTPDQSIVHAGIKCHVGVMGSARGQIT